MASMTNEEFQSSPSPKAGRYDDKDGDEDEDEKVSILAQPEGRAVRRVQPWIAAGWQVSILAQPEGRALRGRGTGRRGRRTCFNPRPARRPGATAAARRCDNVELLFQSSPSPKAGRYMHQTPGKT